MNQPDARLKPDNIDLKFDEVQRLLQRLSDTQNLKIYNMSTFYKIIVAWLLVGLYVLSSLKNGITFHS